MKISTKQIGDDRHVLMFEMGDRKALFQLPNVPRTSHDVRHFLKDLIYDLEYWEAGGELPRK